MNKETFTVVYQKFTEAMEAEERPQSESRAEAGRVEIDEIDELRRMVLDVIEPEPSSYTVA